MWNHDRLLIQLYWLVSKKTFYAFIVTIIVHGSNSCQRSCFRKFIHQHLTTCQFRTSKHRSILHTRYSSNDFHLKYRRMCSGWWKISDAVPCTAHTVTDLALQFATIARNEDVWRVCLKQTIHGDWLEFTKTHTYTLVYTRSALR